MPPASWVGQVVVKTTRAVGDVDPEAKSERGVSAGHGADEVERCHLFRRWMLDEHPYLACQLSVFNLQAHRGIPRGGRL
jgi:hypothetical protein